MGLLAVSREEVGIRMKEYSYKGFKVVYNVQKAKSSTNLYSANGRAVCSLTGGEPTLLNKFHTEHPTRVGAENEIKKLLENYIDFEWQEFYALKH